MLWNKCYKASNLFIKNLSYFKTVYFHVSVMAKSKFEYVKQFEQDFKCLPNSWIVVRIDGKGFHKFTDTHEFEKPNDEKGLKLMNHAAACVMKEFRDIVVCFGHSDEYSFVFRKNCDVFKRRSDKILSIVNSIFSSSYVFHWINYFPDKKLVYPPCFDARIVLYPTNENLRDYLSWRQADAHINNLYNTCFWTLVLKRPCSTKEAQEVLSGTLSSDKNEILFKEFGINYNDEPEMFRKGTTLIRKFIKHSDGKTKHSIIPIYSDIIKNHFWEENPEILSLQKTPICDTPDSAYFTAEKMYSQN